MALNQGLLWTSLCLGLVYLGVLAVQRLFLSPLARFPGPWLAALSNWYEFYYDVIREGEFTHQIQQLHKLYGPIVRITPTELHIDDPMYFDTLYSRAGRRNKYEYMSGRFGFASDTFSTTDHELHRMRRAAISPFFSASNIATFQPVIRAKVNSLCKILTEFTGEGRVLRLDYAWMAMTTDIITEYCFAKSYNHLDTPDFGGTLDPAMRVIYGTGQFGLHFPAVFPILDMLPEWLVRAVQPVILPVVSLRKVDFKNRIVEIRSGMNQSYKTVDHPTIFHKVLTSDLPESEKTDSRLADEAQLIVAAGIVTTSRALSVASFHLANQTPKLAKLRQELLDAGAGPNDPHVDWRQLEKLPYLNGCVHEAIRLSHGVVTRDPRLAPDTELQYDGWSIPPNTPVSMTTVDILMNEEIFPSPNAFVPERWIGKPDLERFFVPFGKGSRQCVGINLAMAELYITMATVFTRFDFSLFETDESDIDMEHAFLVPYPKWDSKGIRATVKEIQH
ncbi:putative benzoate 4-monooxygenase cytochrome P450 [Xylariales sp. PMI_506]|nr:putative benzoate 4-monooxygenase cytochrome P450 [Xylariales sp. PMI_506]